VVNVCLSLKREAGAKVLFSFGVAAFSGGVGERETLDPSILSGRERFGASFVSNSSRASASQASD